MSDDHEPCGAECPSCGLHVGDVGGPEVMGPTPEGDLRLRSWGEAGNDPSVIEVEFILYCGACRLPWVSSLEMAAEDR